MIAIVNPASAHRLSAAVQFEARRLSIRLRGSIADRGAERFTRMHKRHDSRFHSHRIARVTVSYPSKNAFDAALVKAPAGRSRVAEQLHLLIDAGLAAGVFFGRLNRRFGVEPSRGFSGPSAEFISVNRLTAMLVPLFAPMNNPYLRLRRQT